MDKDLQEWYVRILAEAVVEAQEQQRLMGMFICDNVPYNFGLNEEDYNGTDSNNIGTEPKVGKDRY
jgi:hypothetical protein